MFVDNSARMITIIHIDPGVVGDSVEQPFKSGGEVASSIENTEEKKRPTEEVIGEYYLQTTQAKVLCIKLSKGLITPRRLGELK